MQFLHYVNISKKKKYSKMCLRENKGVCMNIHCSCVVKSYNNGGFNFIFQHVHLNQHFNKKEFLCISDKVIASIAMSKNRILVIWIG